MPAVTKLIAIIVQQNGLQSMNSTTSVQKSENSFKAGTFEIMTEIMTVEAEKKTNDT